LKVKVPPGGNVTFGKVFYPLKNRGKLAPRGGSGGFTGGVYRKGKGKGVTGKLRKRKKKGKKGGGGFTGVKVNPEPLVKKRYQTQNGLKEKDRVRPGNRKKPGGTGAGN
jgi:hypothetical protein